MTALAVASNLCPYCHTHALVNDAGEIICLLCGRSPEFGVPVQALPAARIKVVDYYATAYPPRQCPTCGENFTTPRERQVYCSEDCHPRKTCAVPHCGKEFVVKAKTGLYCSRECSNWVLGRRRRHLPLEITVYHRGCAVCPKEFNTVLSYKILCGSADCRREYKRRRMREYKRLKAKGILIHRTPPLLSFPTEPVR